MSNIRSGGVKTEPCASQLTSPLPKSASTCCQTHSAKAGARITRITVKYDVGFTNELYVRGVGPGLSWNKGIKLRNRKADEWVWETDQPFERGEFKVLINDAHYEKFDNHKLSPGADIVYTPAF
jgi:hypothetical protein